VAASGRDGEDGVANQAADQTPHEPTREASQSPPPAGRDPWFGFALRFGALAVLSEIVYYGAALDSELFQQYLSTLAKVSGEIIGMMSGGVRVRQAVISGDLFSVEIARGCDAYRICALLCAAIIAFPAPLRKKFWGLGLGLLWLNSLNLVRIVGLYFIGGFFYSQFHQSHEIYFPIFLICMTVLAWVVWVRWATNDLERA
jgi:exosortase/archaeosortase family protein